MKYWFPAYISVNIHLIQTSIQLQRTLIYQFYLNLKTMPLDSEIHWKWINFQICVYIVICHHYQCDILIWVKKITFWTSRSEYSWNTAHWTLSNNQSINQSQFFLQIQIKSILILQENKWIVLTVAVLPWPCLRFQGHLSLLQSIIYLLVPTTEI